MKIEEPLEKDKIHLHSRIVFPPMATHSTDDGIPTPMTAAHYLAVAENPYVGLIITEHSYIDPQGKADPKQISFASDDVIEAQKRLTDDLHSTSPDIRIFAQINHAGANTAETITGESVVGPSVLQLKNGFSRELTIDEIKAIEEKFAQAAIRVKKAGYDGVEIHAAHGYLLNEFYSPLSNYRKDEYGSQNIESRLRFLLETVQTVRDAVGDYPVAVRLGGCDYMKGGSTIDDAVQAAELLQKAGVDLLDLSGGMCGPNRKDNHNPGYFGDMSAAVVQKVTIPVLVTGGIRTKEQAEQMLNDNKADLIGVGRALYANGRWGM